MWLGRSRETNPGESQCSYVLGDEHMEVRCGVVDPARVGLAKKAISVDSSSSEEDSSSSSGSSSSEESSGSDDEKSSGDSGSGEDDRDEITAAGQKKKGRSDTGAPPPARPSSDVAAARPTAAPAGIPARGPAVLYRCRVLHGAGSTFLVLSCPNVAYVPAVRDHAIVRGARGKDRWVKEGLVLRGAP